MTTKAQLNIKVLLDRGEFRDLLRRNGEIATDILWCVVHMGPDAAWF
jgi:hypothetical protein